MADYFAVTSPGLEAITAAELERLGIPTTGPVPGGVSFSGGRQAMYRANLESRTAGRILMRLGDFRARTWFELERHATRMPWAMVLPPGIRPEFEVTSRKSRLYHVRGIAERLGEWLGPAPADAPVQGFVVRVVRDQFTISADTSGALLHRRGYRLETAKAPMRETLAAAMLLACDWRGQEPLLDPFCGSGTIPIEAALIARRIPPGLNRSFAFEQWPEFDAEEWQEVRVRARARILPAAGIPLSGSDRDAGAIAASESNARRAGVRDDLMLTAAAVSLLPAAPGPGLLLSNPPYGERVGGGDLRNLFAQLGHVARRQLGGWRVGLLVPGRSLVTHAGFQWDEAFRTSNGGIDVQLYTTHVPVLAVSRSAR